jgi:hypothetical protein
MILEPVTANIPPAVYRVARKSGLLVPSEIRPADAGLPKAGNRFDVPGGGVIYAATRVETCYSEVLSRYRVSPKIRKLLADEKDFMAVGGVPLDWRLQRSVAEIHAVDPLPFFDVDHPDTMAYLGEALADVLTSLGYDDNPDLAVLCNQDRLLSRAIAHHAYTAADDDGVYIYGGIRYTSRLDPAGECWAIFDGTELELTDTRAIELHDPDLKRIEKRWGIRLF